ncbi:MAG: OmpA family protein [Pseudomonadota bacterium]
MKNSAKPWAALLAIMTLSACAVTGTAPNSLPTFSPELNDEIDLWTVDLDEVRAMVPQGSAFNQGLREGYLRLADDLRSPLETPDFRHFLRKAVASAQGFDVQPDMVGFRNVAEVEALDLEAARARMLSALDSSGRTKAPIASANAQVAYDCWLMYQARDNQAGIERCRAEFETALGDIESNLTSNIDNMFLVFFAWNQAILTPVTTTILEQVADDFSEGEATQLIVGGHADRSGSERYNLELSELRARAVAAELSALGVPVEDMTIEWFGEAVQLVPTEDGVREPENRRVEILFQ